MYLPLRVTCYSAASIFQKPFERTGRTGRCRTGQDGTGRDGTGKDGTGQVGRDGTGQSGRIWAQPPPRPHAAAAPAELSRPGRRRRNPRGIVARKSGSPPPPAPRFFFLHVEKSKERKVSRNCATATGMKGVERPNTP